MEQSIQQLRKLKRNEWDESDKQLIEFVKETPVIYDPKAKLDKPGEKRNDALNRIWTEFAAKYNYTVYSRKTRWNTIKENYTKIKLKLNRRKTITKKYMDGRLSFLDPLIIRNNAPMPVDKVNSLFLNEITTDIVIESYFKVGLIENRNDFTDFEKLLVDLVKNHPVLYDPRISLNIEPKSRKQIINDLWKQISGETGVSDSDCQTTWNKISMEYYRVQCMKDEHEINNPCFLKFFTEKFNFLEEMYLLIKETTIDVFKEKSIEIAISKSYRVWDDFQLILIDFVKENRVIYEYDADERNLGLHRYTLRELWTEFSKRFKIPNINKAATLWSKVRHNYIKFIREIADTNIKLNSLPFCHLRYQKLSFLNEALSVSTTSCNESLHTFMEEDSIKLKTEENSNVYDSMLDVEDNFFSHENLVSNDEPQPSTSINKCRIEPEHSKNIHNTTLGDSGEFLVENEVLSVSTNSFNKTDDSMHASKKIYLETIFIEEDSIDLKTEENSNVYDSMLEVEDNFFSHELLVSNDKPQPSTSNKYRTLGDSGEFLVENYETKPGECVQEATSMENYHLCDSVVEVEDNLISHENLVSNDEPQPSTSLYTYSLEPEISAEKYFKIPGNNKDRSTEYYGTKSGECVEESKSMANHHNLSTMDFFKEIGKIVMKNFDKNEQRNIQMKSWGLITELKLSMLQEDTGGSDVS